MSVRVRMAAATLCLLAVLVPAWWIALYASEPFRGLFVRPDDWGRLATLLYADAGLAVLTGAAGVKALGRSLSPRTAGAAIGAWGYATLWTVGAAVSGPSPALGAILMVVAFALVFIACHALVSPGRADHR